MEASEMPSKDSCVIFLNRAKLGPPCLCRGILEGNVCDLLEHDLQELTRRPLIIRTDGIDIPQEKRQMLPPSEDLRTATEAKEWLRNLETEECVSGYTAAFGTSTQCRKSQ